MHNVLKGLIRQIGHKVISSSLLLLLLEHLHLHLHLLVRHVVGLLLILHAHTNWSALGSTHKLVLVVHHLIVLLAAHTAHFLRLLLRVQELVLHLIVSSFEQGVFVLVWFPQASYQNADVVVWDAAILDEVFNVSVLVSHFSSLVNELLLQASEVLISFLTLRPIALH